MNGILIQNQDTSGELLPLWMLGQLMGGGEMSSYWYLMFFLQGAYIPSLKKHIDLYL